jgi:CRP-like cAMP-binding protein
LEESYRIHLWSRDHFLPYLLGNGHMSWELSRQMVTRMQTASEMVEVLAFQPVAGRLANLLLDRYGDAVEDYVARDLTLDEMVVRIGSTRETVCRVLYRLAKEGSIHVKRTEFMITDREKLGNHTRIIKGYEK